jgi:tetratricopeptide (TPR) repeat protein
MAMSYINDALRKAQKEKDNRYEPFGGVIAPGPEGPNRARKRRVIVGTIVALVILVSAVLLFAVYGLQQPSARPKEAAPPLPATVAEKPAPKATERAIRSPDGPPVTREADVRYQEALIAQRVGDLRRAEALYKKVLALDPGHVRALNNLGVIYMGQKKRGKAIAVFGRAVVLKKDYVDPYYNLACLYAQTNEIDESLWYLKVAVAIDGGVINWVKKDADMKNVVASPEFKKIMEGQKN